MYAIMQIQPIAEAKAAKKADLAERKAAKEARRQAKLAKQQLEAGIVEEDAIEHEPASVTAQHIVEAAPVPPAVHG